MNPHDGVQAFPDTGLVWKDHDGIPHVTEPREGMTYRQWLIGQAIVGSALPGVTQPDDCKVVALVAISIADEVIKELERRP